MRSNLATVSLEEARGEEHHSRHLYFVLNRRDTGDVERSLARNYLHQQLELARALPNEVPEDLADLDDWVTRRSEAVGMAYRDYLAARKAGAPRRFFSNRSHALYFLNAVAPTKLVDGAWLYGVLQRWQEPDYLPLIQTYLEELGDGVAGQNHVVLYKKLLAMHGCEHWRSLTEPHFVQGAIQLALACNAERFLPEIIGYNLGYEQLPLHLLITSYELNELGIDPYYFTLHITIDNASTGHAHKALRSLQQLLPLVGDTNAFYQRVIDGYRLNDLGANTMSVIESFDLEKEVLKIMRAKAGTGKNMHSNYCRVAGRTINDWLADPHTMPDFLNVLTGAGWITRGEPAESSRFWHLIEGEHAEMFGVFSAYEQQMLRDWIASPSGLLPPEGKGANHVRVPSFRARQRALAPMTTTAAPEKVRHIGAARAAIRQQHASDDTNDFTQELRTLEEQIGSLAGREVAMHALIQLMSPACHHTRAGLMATRVFKKLLV